MPKIKINDSITYYKVTGDGHPIVFIHGGGLESSSWNSQTTFFSKRYRVIAYDIRGHGRSQVPESSYSIDDCVEDLNQLLDHLAVRRTYLAGFSMGGNIALSFTLSHPDKVEALILTGTNSGPMIETSIRKGKEFVARMMRLKGTEASMKYMYAHEANVCRPDLTNRLSEIRRPVLIIVGDQDMETPCYMSEEIHKSIEGSQMVILPNCGHKCDEEQSDTFNSIMNAFLQRV